jgi:hypothetical protein
MRRFGHRQAEVGKYGCAVRAEQDVGRLQIAVDCAGSMHCRQTLRHAVPGAYQRGCDPATPASALSIKTASPPAATRKRTSVRSSIVGDRAAAWDAATVPGVCSGGNLLLLTSDLGRALDQTSGRSDSSALASLASLCGQASDVPQLPSNEGVASFDLRK